ncbi:MAG: DUF2336 domain-containing protein [Rhodobiaceae bacterium]|nr:DUF2336 domain-containing protein [Rhodobiaceae bacterium]MCC0017322.1 DUF2336 domain-containing protein [Rhodobiaceae bacterium]MCC0041088.1 DUF2336 domain-containing protein [Rhodobiaceae bacterium]
MTGNVAVDALMMLAQENSSEKRRELLHAVTDLFLASVPTNDAQSALFDDVMTRVASEAGVDGRRDLSVRIAPIDTAPRGIVNQLARDEDISVAGPVLTQSNVLSGDDLVQIAETKGQQHMSAISERQSISSIVTDVLIRRGNHTVLRNVSGNEGAELSENGARTLSEKAVQDAEIQRNLYRRSDLPEAVAKAVHSRGDVADDAMARISAKHPVSNLIPVLVSKFVQMSGLDAERVEKAILTERMDLFVIICRALDLDVGNFERLVRYRTDLAGKQNVDMEPLLHQFETLPTHAAQRMARFLKVRQTVA